MKKILFVCLGNICRSPAAHAIMQRKVELAGLSQQFFIDSAGTSNYHPGELPDLRMREAGAKRGYCLNSQARTINPSDLQAFDMIITMDENNYRNVKEMMKQQQWPKLSRMSDFSNRYDFFEVPDPYYGGTQGFRQVFALLEDACAGLLKQLETSVR